MRLEAVLRGSRRVERIARYVAAGLVTSAVYTGLALLLHRPGLAADPALAACLAFLLTQPLAFLIHRRITYPDAAARRGQSLRFLLVSAVGLVVSVLIADLVERAGWSFLIALVVGWFVIPAINFLITSVWVFRPPHLLSMKEPGQ